MIEINSETWQAVLRYIEDQQNILTKTLWSEMTEERKTQFVRGQLDSLRALRRLPEIQNISVGT